MLAQHREGSARRQERQLLQRKLRVTERTIRRLLTLDPAVSIPRRTHCCSAKVKERRRICHILALKTKRINGRRYPVFPSCSSISEELRKTHRIVASSEQVRRDLRTKGLKCFVRRHVPSREPAVVQEKKDFARRMIRKPKKFLADLVFSDEVTISVNDHTCRTQWCRTASDVVGRESQRIQNIPHVMIWAAIGVGWKSPIVVFGKQRMNEHGEFVPYRLNGKDYVRRCLSRITPHVRTRIFQHDNARPHIKGSVKAYLTRMKVAVLQWPPYSPDLSPIENVWPLFNRRVSEKYPRTQAELEAAVREAWDELPQSVIDKHVLSFKSKCAKYAKSAE